MIELEYIIAQHQDGNTSVAIKSKKLNSRTQLLELLEMV